LGGWVWDEKELVEAGAGKDIKKGWGKEPLPYPQPDFIGGNILDEDTDPVDGYFLLLFGEIKIPGKALIGKAVFLLRYGIDILRRHAGIKNMVFPPPQMSALTDSKYNRLEAGG